MIGLEFGDDFIRGFAETGLRTQFMIIQQADREVRGYQDVREACAFNGSRSGAAFACISRQQGV